MRDDSSVGAVGHEPTKNELMQCLDEIERQVREARGEKVDKTPWDFKIPTGSDLRHMREKCGLSKEEAADALGYNGDTIYNYENGNKAPGRKFIQQALLLYKREWPR